MGTVRKHYSKEFKEEAVKLVTAGTVSLSQASRDLDINQNVLRRGKHREPPRTKGTANHHEPARTFTTNRRELSPRTGTNHRELFGEEEAARLRAEVERERHEREQDREEIRFLRGLVERRDRDAAELRAALREALKTQPRQLEAPALSPETAQERPQIAEPPKTAAQPDEAGKSPPKAKNAAQMKEPRPLWRVILGLR